MSTSKPASREEFKQFCLRRLGAPLLEINVADEQVEDCIEIAFQYYYDYHYDATEKVYLAHAVTQTDITNKYITDSLLPINNTWNLSDKIHILTIVYLLLLSIYSIYEQRKKLKDNLKQDVFVFLLIIISYISCITYFIY